MELLIINKDAYHCNVQTDLIRPVGIDDISELVPLFDAYRQFYQQSSDLNSAESFIVDRLQRNEATIYGYFIGHQLVGFTLLYPMFSSVRMKPFYLLNDLYVLPEHRNEHIGSALLKYCQVKAKEDQQAGIMLETDKSNQVGNHLYPSIGFEYNESSNFYFWENK